jgi:hypothetical protein
MRSTTNWTLILHELLEVILVVRQGIWRQRLPCILCKFIQRIVSVTHLVCLQRPIGISRPIRITKSWVTCDYFHFLYWFLHLAMSFLHFKVIILVIWLSESNRILKLSQKLVYLVILEHITYASLVRGRRWVFFVESGIESFYNNFFPWILVRLLPFWSSKFPSLIFIVSVSILK